MIGIGFGRTAAVFVDAFHNIRGWVDVLLRNKMKSELNIFHVLFNIMVLS